MFRVMSITMTMTVTTLVVNTGVVVANRERWGGELSNQVK